jgi:hypothetical protein
VQLACGIWARTRDPMTRAGLVGELGCIHDRCLLLETPPPPTLGHSTPQLLSNHRAQLHIPHLYSTCNVYHEPHLRGKEHGAQAYA